MVLTLVKFTVTNCERDNQANIYLICIFITKFEGQLRVMGSFLDKIKSLLVKKVEKHDSESEINLDKEMGKEKNQRGEENRAQESKSVDQSKVSSGKPNNDFLAILINAMQEASKEEATYLEFKQNIKSLKHLDFDDKTRYETAFAIASNQGVDKEKLLQSAAFFQRVLDNEGNKFNETLEAQRSNRVEAKKFEIKEIRDQIFDKQNEIEKIKEEIRKLEEKISAEKNVLIESKNRIEQTASDFISSLNFLKAKIVKDIENFNKYF